MGKPRILVVEDESIIAKDIENALKEMKYTVAGIAFSGEDAVKKAAETKPDLVLMDIVLRGKMDGIEAAEQIRTWLNIPIVYLTAYEDEKTLGRAKLTEPFGYLIKPFDERELHSTIEIALYKFETEKRLKESMLIKIFILSDEAILRDGLRYLLENQEDMKVVGDAGDLSAMREQIKKSTPDVGVMITGISRPKDIDEISRIHKLCLSMQIVLLSGHLDVYFVHRALKAGALGFVLKGSGTEELLTAIRAVHAKRRYLSREIAETAADQYLREGLSPEDPLERLSSREREVLQLLAEGKSNAEIAKVLFLSRKTIETYRSRLMQKMGITNILDLVRFAVQHGLISL